MKITIKFVLLYFLQDKFYFDIFVIGCVLTTPKLWLFIPCTFKIYLIEVKITEIFFSYTDIYINRIQMALNTQI